MTSWQGSKERHEEVRLPYAHIRRSEASSRQRWSLRAAQWRVLELARAVFGEEAQVTQAAFPARGVYRGMLNLEVPFFDLERHEAGEALFLHWVRQDEILQAVPLVYTFQPILSPPSRKDSSPVS